AMHVRDGFRKLYRLVLREPLVDVVRVCQRAHRHPADRRDRPVFAGAVLALAFVRRSDFIVLSLLSRFPRVVVTGCEHDGRPLCAARPARARPRLGSMAIRGERDCAQVVAAASTGSLVATAASDLSALEQAAKPLLDTGPLLGE